MRYSSFREFPGCCGILLVHGLEWTDTRALEDWYSDKRHKLRGSYGLPLVFTDVKGSNGQKLADFLKKEGHRIKRISMGCNPNSDHYLHMFIAYPIKQQRSTKRA